MKGIDGHQELSELPEFELTYAIDEEGTPTRIVVLPRDTDEPTASWIIIDEESAISLTNTL